VIPSHIIGTRAMGGATVITRFDRAVLALVAAYVAVLALLPFVLAPATFHAAFSETGPFERLSLLAWIGAAAIVLVRIRPLGLPAAAFTLLYLLFAAREADLHKAFTTGSISKLNYYKDASIAASERVLAAMAAAAILLLICYAAFRVVRFLAMGGWRTRTGIWLMLGWTLLVLGKMLDRSAAVLTQILHVVRPSWVIGVTDSFEEGLELATPALLALSAWLCSQNRSYLHSSR